MTQRANNSDERDPEQPGTVADPDTMALSDAQLVDVAGGVRPRTPIIDVCKPPSGAGPIPIPYPGQPAGGSGGSGGQGSSSGDDAGVAKGMWSGGPKGS